MPAYLWPVACAASVRAWLSIAANSSAKTARIRRSIGSLVRLQPGIVRHEFRFLRHYPARLPEPATDAKAKSVWRTRSRDGGVDSGNLGLGSNAHARSVPAMPAIVQDLLIIGTYFAIIIGIGVHFSRRNKNVSEFALGGRSIPWWAVLASILASEISAGTFFGTPGEGFRLRNYTYAQLMIGYLLARVVVSAVFIPAYYKYDVVSIYEFLELRFGPRTRRFASVVFLVTRSLASGSRLWVPTLLLVVIWNRFHPEHPLRNWEQFWFTGAALVLITILTAAYTAVGGIKAVIWTDVLQIAVLFGALGFSVWYLFGHIPGGWEGVKSHLDGAARPRARGSGRAMLRRTRRGERSRACWRPSSRCGRRSSVRCS